jgi:hypothetical protein
MNQTAVQSSKRRNASGATRRAADREKCTLLLQSDLSLKLSVAAHLRGLDRSELVNELLTDALRYVVVSIRGQSPGSAAPTAEVKLAGDTAA